MTKKKLVTIISILFGIIVLNIVMFGFIFRLKNQKVVVVGGCEISIQESEIIEIANIKNNSSTFLIDKDKATENIELNFPDIKVIQIKTTGIQSIEFVLRARHATYFIENYTSYYILDEELKVLKVIQKLDNPNYNSGNLIRIESDEITISSFVKAGNFIGTEVQQQIYESFHNEILNVAIKQVDNEEKYFERQDVLDFVTAVKYEKLNSYDKIVVKTSDGVKLDIENPSENISNKINICFSLIKKFKIEDANKNSEEQRFKNGIIKIYYDLEDNYKAIYLEE